MGLPESQQLLKLNKAQGETNERLASLIAEMQNTNRWLAHLVKLFEEREPATSVS